VAVLAGRIVAGAPSGMPTPVRRSNLPSCAQPPMFWPPTNVAAIASAHETSTCCPPPTRSRP
jgi:hypothetical protein